MVSADFVLVCPFYLMLTEQYINNDSKVFCRCLCIAKVQGF